MLETNTIEHLGVVKSINDNFIDVKITNHPSCLGCAATNICDVSGKSNKTIRAKILSGVNIDEKVSVVMALGLGFRALLMGYMLPFLIVLTLIIILSILKINELLVAVISLSLVALYYFGIFLKKEKIGKKFSFSIKKLNK